ncbi:AGAP004217-PA [Anopheles gambiae str. PEST]|uniref:AGAP004217-PA n=1 Tax=Anopheles gambiae TaxID=7165 RepID=A0NDF1_ANOGA|nr:AGAP004217-PA [Anopheles gambiae str. PEST]
MSRRKKFPKMRKIAAVSSISTFQQTTKMKAPQAQCKSSRKLPQSETATLLGEQNHDERR